MPTKESLKITFSKATPSLNQLNGKWSKLNWKKKFLSELRNYEFLARKEKVFKTLKIIRYGSRLLDVDNLTGGCKTLIDAIKEKGLIVDDSPKWINLEVKQIKVKRGEEKTVVEII